MSEFQVLLKPTPEIYMQPLADGREVPLRIWQGYTSDGFPVEVYVFAIVPEHEHMDAETMVRYRASLPTFMRPAREVHDLVTDEAAVKAANKS